MAAHTETIDGLNVKYERTMITAAIPYHEAWSPIPTAADEINAAVGRSALPWDDEAWSAWSPAVDGAPAVTRLGQLIEPSPWDTLSMPALIPFVGGQSLLIKSDGSMRSEVVAATQSFLLRLLAAIPPGRLRFVFIDPVGLGQNVAPFMHLADHDDALVTARAWTEPHHIEQRLADLTEHMENVIQKYLRNQLLTSKNTTPRRARWPSRRVLVVHDFPANFSESAARRLVSVLQSGPRCGVYAVVHADPTRPRPHGFELGDLERSATVITQKGSRFVWADTWPNAEESYTGCILKLDAPPPAVLFNDIVKAVGKAAKDAARVEVPFARIAPPRSQWWRGFYDTEKDTYVGTEAGLRALIGPAGAQRFQTFELGRSMAQHALVAGKIGSGKSTLLHVLITNLALTYSPQELELYLIDFKKGVEFKNYAVHALPHAH